MGQRIVLKHGHVITMDPTTGELPHTDVAVQDGVIVAIGKDTDAAASGGELVDVRGAVVMPGFLDAHRHVWQAPLRGIGHDMSLGAYLTVVLGRIAPRYRPADLRLSALLGAVEALDAGVTTVFDWCNATLSAEHADAGIEGLAQAGIRAVFGHGNPDDERDVVRLAGRTGLVTTALAIVGPEYMPFDLAARHIALAREHGLVTSMHVGGGTSGPSAKAVTQLRDAGLLGPDLQFVHGNTIADDEVRALVDSGAGVVVTPAVECLMGHGTPAFGRFTAAGGTPALGVDVVVATGADMFAQMRAVLLHERMRANQAALDADRNPDGVTPAAADLLRAATTDGARAAGLADQVGSLTVGKRADVVVLDGLAHLADDPAAAGAVVTSLGPADVRTVLVDGRIVKRDGQLVDHDLAALREAANELAHRVLAGIT